MSAISKPEMTAIGKWAIHVQRLDQATPTVYYLDTEKQANELYESLMKKRTA